jgi:hypothetical protein
VNPGAVLAATAPSPLWYLARASGVVSLVLLTVSTVLGIATTVRWSSERWPRFTLSYLHRNVSLLAFVFLAVHIATIVVDGFAPIGWKDAVAPFVSGYRPLWLGFGALAFDLMVAVAVTSLVRRHIGARLWRAVHWASYPLWTLAVLHGLGSGTDTRTTLVLVVYAACVGAVVAAVWWRCAVAVPRDSAARTGAIAVSVLGPVALAIWTLVGPLGAHWAARAGTPASLLGTSSSGTTSSASSGGTAPTTGSLGSDFSASFSGSAGETTSGNTASVVVNGELADGSDGTLTVSFRADRGASQLFVQSGTVTIADRSGRTIFTGTITEATGGRIVAVSDSNGTTIRVTFDTFDPGSGRASGSVQTVSPDGERNDR